ncbi:hypothetical protein V8F06_006074 [Rhypophila decipiens]
MSGFEIAGVVLGALPVLFACVDLPKQGARRSLLIFRKPAYIDKLARALLLQKQIIAENIKSLACAAGCENVWLVDEDPVAYLNDEVVQDHILDYLGFENYTALSAVLDQSHGVLKGITEKIQGLVPGGGKGSSDDILEIIAANRVSKGAVDILPRIKLTFAAKDIQSIVEELDKAAANIDRFTRVLLSNRQMMRNTPSRKAIRLAKALRRAGEHAQDLSVALHDRFRSECHTRHEANLLLEDRISIASSILDTKRKAPMEVVLRLALAMESQPGSSVSYSAAVYVQGDSRELDTTPTKSPQPLGVQTTTVAQEKRLLSVGSSGSQRVHFQTTTARVVLTTPLTPPMTPHGVVWVECMCSALASMTAGNTHASFLLTKDRQIGMCNRIEAPTQPLLDCNKRITMQELFLDANTARKWPLKFRMFLAIRLASNLLQLYQTQWLRNFWSKSNILFPLRTGAAKNDFADLDKPLLGIMLLEIWHQESFESMHATTGPVPTGYYQKLAFAMEWLDDTTDPMPEQYDRAVSLCIRGIVGGTSHFDEGDDSFWGAVWGDIIEPLQKNCKPWQRSQ